jgi:hypothetical protein
MNAFDQFERDARRANKRNQVSSMARCILRDGGSYLTMLEATKTARKLYASGYRYDVIHDWITK